ncbi:hypothetical protein DL765_011163 [Monosporascus sp. GIB2]|nr:hypothetical protein DL765_011163 [Monosporascus sp. GIB2]
MADDHASKAISCYGSGINHTPHIDRLASEGMKFNHCYVTNSICTPSRAAILTGTHNHVNGVMTLDDKINKHMPNVAKHLRSGGYRTAMVGKWHMGEGRAHEPTGFDYWSVLPGQGDYWDPEFIEPAGERVEHGYVTDIITDKCLNWIAQTNERGKPFFLMCHHKAPHRSWECDNKHKDLYADKPIRVPETYNDDYEHRAKAAKVAKMRVAEDMTYQDLGLVQPDGGDWVGERVVQESGSSQRKVPIDATKLIDKDTGEIFTFKNGDGLPEFKFQRYMQRYLRTIQSIDDNVGRMLDYLDQNGLAENTIVIYTSDQGFFLGEHGWFDKRFMYEESFQMPFLIRYPAEIAKGSLCDDIICNVDFAPTFLDFARLRVPNYMQGVSFRELLHGKTPADWQQVAYHRYWMHNDIIHHARAHYGVRDQRYKLIYWYNESLGVAGARPGAEDEKEWELFDCREDPLELFNVYHDPKYEQVVKDMTRLLEKKMEEIGDEPVHTRMTETSDILSIYINHPKSIELGRWRRGCECVYPTPKRSLQHPPSQPSSLGCGEPQHNPASTQGSGFTITKEMMSLIDIFFERIYPLPSYSFLHPATTKRRFREGRGHYILALAISALTAALDEDQDPNRTSAWIQAAEQIIWEQLASPSVSRLQALVLIIHYRMVTGEFKRAFMLVAIAARSAAAMLLNHERPDMDRISQEVRRRLVWSLKIVERYFSVGLPEFELCPLETIFLQLPSTEEDFGADQSGELGSYSLHVRLEAVRRDIMKLTRSVALCDQPFPMLVELVRRFEQDLREILSQMPDGAELTAVQVAELLKNPWMPRRVLLPISWHQAHCDLYRLLLRGYPEAAPKVVLDALDPSHTATAESECLKHSTAIIQTLTNLNQQSTSRHLLEFDMAICGYHASRLLLFISRLGTSKDRPAAEFVMSRVDLCLAALRRFFSSSELVKPIIEELQAWNRKFHQHKLGVSRPSSPHLSPSRGDGQRKLSMAARTRQRLAIHSLLRQAGFSDGEDHEQGTSVHDARLDSQTTPAVLSDDSSAGVPPEDPVSYSTQESANAPSSIPILSAVPNDWESGMGLSPGSDEMQFPLLPWLGRQGEDTVFDDLLSSDAFNNSNSPYVQPR